MIFSADNIQEAKTGVLGANMKFRAISSTPSVTAGQVCTIIGGVLALAGAATDKTKMCVIATEDWTFGDTAQNYFSLSATKPSGTESHLYKYRTKTVNPAFVVGLKCGLDATGKKLDPANTVELVEITEVAKEANGELQVVYFRFI